MQQTAEIKKFLYSQYFSDGLRITFGVLLPSVIFAQLGHLALGITISLGAITASIPDSPGPVVYKRNAMLVCIFFMLFVAFTTGLINTYPFLVAVLIFLFCFFFSMFNIYGNRASSISTAVLIIMVLTIDQDFTLHKLLIYTGLLAIGGIWYTILSLALSQFRPYRIAQHTLGECIGHVGEYLRLKSDFYNPKQDLDENYTKLIDQQIKVHQQQDSVREVLFKDKMITRNSTNTGRLLILIFSDMNDIFEHSMATHYDYKAIQQTFGHTDAFESLFTVIRNVSTELQNIGTEINSNERPRPLYNLRSQLEQLKTNIDKVENNLILKKILINLIQIVKRIEDIYSYFKTKNLNTIAMSSETDLGRFVSPQSLDLKLFVESLTFKSSIFRHSLRVAIVCVIGYMISKNVPGSHSHWILLTILVILKPAFSLTKKRNYQRLIGTFIGAVAGASIIHYIDNENARFAFLLIFMILTYSFQRLNYVVSVLFMTPFTLLMLSFIGLGTLSVVSERIIDTVIGSTIALIASYFIFPSWEYRQLKDFMHKLLLANYNYLHDVAEGLTGKGFNITEYKLIRKELYLSSANMASALQRMLSEPKNKQKSVREVNSFIVLNHVLSSYIATLVSTLRNGENKPVNAGQIKIIRKALYRLAEAISILKSDSDTAIAEVKISAPATIAVDETVDSRLITEQLQFINKVSKDLLKICENMRDGISVDEHQLSL